MPARPSGMIARFKELAAIWKDGSPDLRSSAGRSRDRYRRAAMTSAAIMCTRVMNVLTGLVMVPLTANYLGKDQFGMWMAVTSVIAFMGFADFGLGVGIQNALISCSTNNDYDRAQRVIGLGFAVLSSICVPVVVVALVVLPKLPLPLLFRFDDPDSGAVLMPTAQAMLICFAIGIPAGLVQRVCDAFQRGYWGYALLFTGRSLAFGGVVVAVLLRSSLPLLATVLMVTPFVTSLVGFFVILCSRFPHFRPRWPGIDGRLIRSVFSVSGQALLCNIGAQFVNNMPNIIIANQVSVSAVAPVAVTQKLVQSASLVISPMLASIWGPVGDAVQRGEVEWVRTLVRRVSAAIVGVYVPIMLLFILYGRNLVQWWTGNEGLVPSWSLLVALVAGGLLAVLTQVVVIVLYGFGRFLIRGLSLIGFGVGSGMFCYCFSEMLGASGIIWTFNVGALAIFVAVSIELWSALRHSQLSTIASDSVHGNASVTHSPIT